MLQIYSHIERERERENNLKNKVWNKECKFKATICGKCDRESCNCSDGQTLNAHTFKMNIYSITWFDDEDGVKNRKSIFRTDVAFTKDHILR